GFHKYLAEQCVIRHAPEWLIFRMGGFVGSGLKKNAIYDILHGGPLWLSPDSALQFINVDTAADVILDMALSDRKSEVYNLCGSGVIRLSEVMAAVGKAVECKPDSPAVRYEVSTDKLRAVTDIPSTRDAVLAYVKEQLAHEND
ncbi:MAG: NAD(P)-dependent oxidoreductase, partial [Oscillospiraceae bacterium]